MAKFLNSYNSTNLPNFHHLPPNLPNLPRTPRLFKICSQLVSRLFVKFILLVNLRPIIFLSALMILLVSQLFAGAPPFVFVAYIVWQDVWGWPREGQSRVWGNRGRRSALCRGEEAQPENEQVVPRLGQVHHLFIIISGFGIFVGLRTGAQYSV